MLWAGCYTQFFMSHPPRQRSRLGIEWLWSLYDLCICLFCFAYTYIQKTHVNLAIYRERELVLSTILSTNPQRFKKGSFFILCWPVTPPLDLGILDLKSRRWCWTQPPCSTTSGFPFCFHILSMWNLWHHFCRQILETRAEARIINDAP